MKHLIICLLLFFGSIKEAKAGFLFQETFDGPSLPTSLEYITDSASNRWLIDGDQRLFGEKFADVVAYRAAISNTGFHLTPGGLRYSVELGRPLGTVPGGSNIGLIFGNYIAVFHPGFPKDTGGDRGAFRLETISFDNGTISGTQELTSNQDMGFIPALEKLHHLEVFVKPMGTALSIDVTITDGANSAKVFQFSYLDPVSRFGNGNVGVYISPLNPPGTSDAFFDNLSVEGQIVPEPTSLSLLMVSLLIVALVMWRRVRFNLRTCWRFLASDLPTAWHWDNRGCQ